MANFNQSNKSKRDFGGRAMMHQAVCSNCGKNCQVPFKPTGSKPVLCNECFGEQRGNNTKRFSERNFDRSNSKDREMFEAVCAECGESCKVPFMPRSDKPIYCSNCFEKKGNGNSDNRRSNFLNVTDNGTKNYKKELEMINAKLDKILKILIPVTPLEKAEKSEKVEVEETSEVKKKKVKTKKAKVVKKETEVRAE